MAQIFNFDLPPMQGGSPGEQVKQLTSYLYRTIEELNIAFRSVSAGTGAEGVSGADMEIINSQREALKDMIVRTAGTLRREMGESDAALENLIYERESATAETIAQIYQSLIDEIPETRSGVAACSRDLAAGAYEDIAITYDALADLPQIQLTMIADSESCSGKASACVLAQSISTTGCTLRVRNDDTAGGSFDYSLQWTATAARRADNG